MGLTALICLVVTIVCGWGSLRVQLRAGGGGAELAGFLRFIAIVAFIILAIITFAKFVMLLFPPIVVS